MLRAEVDAWFKRHPYDVFGEYEPGPPERYTFKVRFLELIPAEWGIILGDFAHNARSALDHLAYQVVSLGNGGMHVEQTLFPIVVCPFKWESAARHRLPGATERHVRLIEGFQPYHRRLRGTNTVWQSLDDPLAILNRMANVDKHIVLNATPASVSAIGWDLVPVRDIGSIGSSEAPLSFLLDGEDLVRVEIESSGPDPELRLDRQERVEISVQHRVGLTKTADTLVTIPLLESVEAILGRLREILAVFVGEFR